MCPALIRPRCACWVIRLLHPVAASVHTPVARPGNKADDPSPWASAPMPRHSIRHLTANGLGVTRRGKSLTPMFRTQNTMLSARPAPLPNMLTPARPSLSERACRLNGRHQLTLFWRITRRRQRGQQRMGWPQEAQTSRRWKQGCEGDGFPAKLYEGLCFPLPATQCKATRMTHRPRLTPGWGNELSHKLDLTHTEGSLP